MPILENLRKALGFDNEIPDDRDTELPWEEDFTPLGVEAKVPDAASLNMPRLVDALRRLYAALDAETRKAVSDGELPELTSTRAPEPEENTPLTTVGSRDLEALKAEYDKLEAKKREVDNKLRAMQNRVAELERKLSEATKVRTVEPMPVNVARANAEAEVKRLQTLNEQLTTKSKMSDRMLSDMQNSLVEKRREAEALAAENDDLKRRLQEAQPADKVNVDELTRKLAAAEKRINELEVVNSNLKQERKELKETIESNLYNQALNENQMRRRIKQLEGAKSRKRGRSKGDKQRDEAPRRDKSSLDKALDATNWIDGTPEKPADEDFGYQEPPQKPAPDPDEQLSLF